MNTIQEGSFKFPHFTLLNFIVNSDEKQNQKLFFFVF